MQSQTSDLNHVIASKLHLAEVVLKRLYKSKRFEALDRDDAESVAKEAVWRAVEGHNPSKSDLDEHVKHRVRHALLDAVRKAEPPAGDESLVEELCEHNHLDEKSVRAWREEEATAEASEDFRDALDTLSVREARVVSLLAKGNTYRGVRLALGISRRKFREVLGEIRLKLGRFRPHGSDATVYTSVAPQEGE